MKAPPYPMPHEHSTLKMESDICLKSSSETIESHREDSMISIAVGTNIFYLPVDDIYYIKAESNYIRVFTIEGRIFLIARTLKKAAGTLIHNGFIRVHHSYLLHPRHIRAYYPGERLIHLSNQEQIPVSRSNCSRVKAYLAAHAL